MTGTTRPEKLTEGKPAFTTRFAPSPTGRLHRGHAFSALSAWAAAREAGGRFLLRIEDIDKGRCRPEFEAGIYEDLAWLGIGWETPVDELDAPGGKRPVHDWADFRRGGL